MDINTFKELMNIKEKTKTIPLIVIVDNVVHPNLYLPLENLTLELDQKTLEDAVAKHDGYFVISTQIEQPIDFLSPPMIYKIGTLCQITHYNKNENGTQIEYHALFKYRIDSMAIINQSRCVHGEMITEDFTTAISEDTWKEHDKLFFNFIDYVKSFKPEFYQSHKMQYLSHPSQLSPSELISMCLINLKLNVQVKQSILECIKYDDSFKILQEIIGIGLTMKNKFNGGKAVNNSPELTEEEQDFIQKLEKREFPQEVRKIVQREVKRMSQMPPTSGEYHTIENYLTTLHDFPWGESTEEVVDLEKTKQILEDEHFGLEKVKKRIIRQLATYKLTGKKNGIIICLDGPPGVGKTSICKSIADSLNRTYVRIGLGGVNDEAEIRGHRKTYVGAMTGKIVNALIKAKVNNPLIVLDEIDKIGHTSTKGSVDAALLEVLDPEQNTNFNDHFMNTPVDLSNVLFIATSNDISNISKPLRDRMEIISLDSYTIQEKFHIAKNHLIKKEQEKLGLKDYKIDINDSAIKSIIESYTREAGVRGLKKVITEIFQHCAEILLTKNIKSIKITSKNVHQFIDRKPIPKEDKVKFLKAGVVSGLAWTSVGGEVLLVESVAHKGHGKLSITGQLGEVMKESAHIALTLSKVICEDKKIDFNFNEKDIHIHFPAGATPKDGPSAGITLVSSLYSLVTNKKVRTDIAMTGEISLRGEILPVGGIKEKVIGAYKNGKKLVFIPKGNRDDISDIPKEILEDKTFEVRPASHYEEVLKELFK